MTELPYLTCPVINKVFIVSFPGIFKGRTQTYANLFLPENTRAECKLGLYVFPLLVYITLQRLGTLVSGREVRSDNIQSTCS